MYSIHNMIQKIKGFIKNYTDDIMVYIVIIIVSISSFYVGKMSEKTLDNDNIYIVNSEIGDRVAQNTASSITPIKTYVEKKNTYNTSNSTQNKNGYMYVASSRGKLYYRIGCGGSTKLVESNKIFFTSSTEAENRGYKPATNCAP